MPVRVYLIEGFGMLSAQRLSVFLLQSLVRPVVCKPFLPVRNLSSCLSILSTGSRTEQSFVTVMRPCLSDFVFMDHASASHPGTLCRAPGPKDFLPSFFYNFYVLYLSL